MRYVIVLLGALGIGGAVTAQLINKQQQQARAGQVEQPADPRAVHRSTALFEEGGCVVYRFADAPSGISGLHYWVRCAGGGMAGVAGVP